MRLTTKSTGYAFATALALTTAASGAFAHPGGSIYNGNQIAGPTTAQNLQGSERQIPQASKEAQNTQNTSGTMTVCYPVYDVKKGAFDCIKKEFGDKVNGRDSQVRNLESRGADEAATNENGGFDVCYPVYDLKAGKMICG